MKRLLEIVLNAEGTIGGEQRHVLQILDRLDKGRFEAEVLTWDIPAFADELASRRVTTTSVTARHVLDRALLQRIQAEILRGRFDLVHAHGHRAGLLGRYAAVRQRTPHIVWTCHLAENKADENPLVRWGYQRALRYLDARTEATIAVSSLLRDWLVSQGVDGSRITVVPNGVDGTVFRPMPKDASLAKSLGLVADAPIVGTVARLTDQKGVGTLVTAAAEIERRAPGTQLLIVGSGPLEDELKARAAQSGARIVFAGERRDIPALLSLFDVAVVPSLWEGAFCFSILEAMAAGKPVVCSDIPMFTDIVRPGADAFVYPAGDPAGLAGAVHALLRDRPMAKRVAAAGARLVHERFSAEHSSQQTVDVYERLLGGAPS